jgi:hypothetical protein
MAADELGTHGAWAFAGTAWHRRTSELNRGVHCTIPGSSCSLYSMRGSTASPKSKRLMCSKMHTRDFFVEFELATS